MEIPDEDPSETKEDDVEEIVAMPAETDRAEIEEDDDSSCGSMPGLAPQDDLYDSSDSESEEEPTTSRLAYRYARGSDTLQDIPELDSDDSSDEGSYYSSDSDNESEASVDGMESLEQGDAKEMEEPLELLNPADDVSAGSQESIEDWEDINDESCDYSIEEYREALKIVCNLNDRFIVPELEDGVIASNEHEVKIVNPLEAQKVTKDWNKYRYYFLGVDADKIKKTFEATTQYAPTILAGEKVRQTYKSAFPALNIPRRHESVATDTIYASTPSIHS
jgi:hypothetical protein